jgi:hypothetical protein
MMEKSVWRTSGHDIYFRVGQEPLRILPPSHMNVDGDRHTTSIRLSEGIEINEIKGTGLNFF